MRRCLKDPIPELFEAYNCLENAVSAHLLGDAASARDHFRSANGRIIWEWLNSAWIGVTKHVVTRSPIGDTRTVPLSVRDPDRTIAHAVRNEVLSRDGFRCRYCGLPVVHADIRRIAHRLYPDAVPWNSRDARQQHAAFQAFWLQFDHVEPHSHGGRSTSENVVVSCALCNFGKDRHTLRQLDLEDPRLRPPLKSDFDGLEALRSAVSSNKAPSGATPTAGRKKSPPLSNVVGRFFFPAATISSGYVNIRSVGGKSRWFKLGPEVDAISAERNGVLGSVIICSAALLIRRGLDPTEFQDEPGAG